MPYLYLFALVIFLLGTGTGVAAELTGEVVGISDGDTLTLLTPDRRQVKVRLGQIDTPERRQPWGSRARQALADKVFRKQVKIEVEDVDRYGRTVGRVLLDGRDINAEMVAEGHAWAYRDYLHDPRLLDLERAAREAGKGLWSLPEFQRTAPWDWRRQQRAGAQQPSRPAATAESAWQCGAKRYCSEMTSCAEASFFLDRCGLGRLDGDGDGVPCESLCR